MGLTLEYDEGQTPLSEEDGISEPSRILVLLKRSVRRLEPAVINGQLLSMQH